MIRASSRFCLATREVSLPDTYDNLVVMIRPREELLHDVLLQIRPLVLTSARAVEAIWREHDVTVGMRAVLAVLAAGGPRPVPEIASRLELTRQAVQRHVDDLRARGLVTTTANPAHRRSVLIALTREGQQLWHKGHAQDLDALAPMAAEFSRADLETTVQVLEALGRDVRRRLHERADGRA